MLTVRFDGYITARSPIIITRPDQGDVPLTMTVIRDQRLVSVHVIPGETIKGVLRNVAYMACVDAAKMTGELKVGLDDLYLQTLGGLTLGPQNLNLENETTFRARQPLLSLFGAARFSLTGRIIVHHALAQEAEFSNGPVQAGLPPGTRQDGLARRSELFELLNSEDQARWSRQKQSASGMADASRKLKDAKRALARAVRNRDIEIESFEIKVAAMEAEIAILKAKPEFQQTVQRPLPVKNAAPAGMIYEHTIELVDGSLEELGLLIAAIELWNRQPRIGGGRTVGYGQVTAKYNIELLSDSILRRDQTWGQAGTLTLGLKGPVVNSSHPVVIDAMHSWRKMEFAIRSQTDIFSG